MAQNMSPTYTAPDKMRVMKFFKPLIFLFTTKLLFLFDVSKIYRNLI